MLLAGSQHGRGGGGGSTYGGDPIVWLSLSSFVFAVFVSVVAVVVLLRCPFARRWISQNQNVDDLRELRRQRREQLVEREI